MAFHVLVFSILFYPVTQVATGTIINHRYGARCDHLAHHLEVCTTAQNNMRQTSDPVGGVGERNISLSTNAKNFLVRVQRGSFQYVIGTFTYLHNAQAAAACGRVEFL